MITDPNIVIAIEKLTEQVIYIVAYQYVQLFGIALVLGIILRRKR